MGDTTETAEGGVIDIACVRKNTRDDLPEKGHNHSSQRALMGHCVESGYGLVTEDARLTLRDPKATRRVVDTVEQNNVEEGIRLPVTREDRDGTMDTTAVEEV